MEYVDGKRATMQQEKASKGGVDQHERRFGEGGYIDLQEAHNLRSQGNQLYKAGKIDEASETYTIALRQIATEETKEKAILLCNRAACYQRLLQWEDMAADCTRAISLDPEYAKALYRRSIAFESMGRWVDALTDIEAAIQKKTRVV